jgi:hypothetical protein
LTSWFGSAPSNRCAPTVLSSAEREVVRMSKPILGKSIRGLDREVTIEPQGGDWVRITIVLEAKNVNKYIVDVRRKELMKHLEELR